MARPVIIPTPPLSFYLDNDKSQPKRKPKAGSDAVQYITEVEFKQLLTSARLGRHPARDAAILWLMFEHGLRATELAQAKRTHLKLKDARFVIHRLKGS